MNSEKITVTSHVARDFLQNAAYFNTLPKVVWEYVSNSLDNAKDGMPVTVAVDLLSVRPKTLQVADDGVGMSRQDLARFFQMHGENIQRKRGKRVRGRFGTGKSAAFGIADTLTIDTVQDGRRNVVRLTRADIQGADHGGEFPVEVLVADEAVDPAERDDGTIIQVSGFLKPKLRLEQTIMFVERHLGRYKSRANVIINGHQCEFREPPFVRQFTLAPPAEVASRISECELTIKVSPTPLDKESTGIDILSYGIWHETTLVGIENKELSNRIFGEIDVPILEDYEGPIPTFDNTRNSQLNRANPLVVVLLAWMMEEIEKVRKLLVQEERDRKKSERFRQLEKRAREIEDVLNNDFLEILEQYELAKRVSTRPSSRLSTTGSDGETLPGDGSQQTDWQQVGRPPIGGTRGNRPPGDGDAPRPGGPGLIGGSQKGSPRDVAQKGDRKRRGIFTIEWTEGSDASDRSEYGKETRSIYINLNHPQVSYALKASGGSVDASQFREIVYEIAVVEYALAVQYERADNEELDIFDGLFEVRRIIDRVTRRITELLVDTA